ncbi:porin [Leucothrix sargassi]|nr:porin [Leucothrix sargassi]
MKKLILATAIATITASGAASAANIYEKDDLTVRLNGDFQVQLLDPVGEGNDTDLDYDDLELSIGADYKLNDRITAFGNLTLDYKNQVNDEGDDNVVDQAYIGLKVGGVRGSIGRQYWASDDFGVEKAIELDGGTAFNTTGGDDTLRFDADMGRYSASLSYDFDGEGDDASVVDVAVSTNIGRAKVGLNYQDYSGGLGEADDETYGVLASVDVGRANVGIDYSQNETAEYTNVSVGFPVARKTSAAVGMTFEAPEGGNNDINHWYANATHKLNSNVSVFAEIGDNDDAEDLGALAGMRVQF